MNFVQTSARFLHVILKRVDSPGKGSHNKLEFAAAVGRPTSELEAADSLALRLVARFPAVLLGFTVHDPLGYRETRATTVTYAFQWPGPDVASAGANRIIDAIVANEGALQEHGRA